MRKIIAISFLIVFTVLQYGKIASWLYCELRTEIVDQRTTHCDCEKIFADGNDSQQSLPLSHSHTQKDKLSELYTTITNQEEITIVIVNTSCFVFHSVNLQKGFLKSLYHPPA